ncbi:hypothetical protein ABIA15_005378 [Sinorhizobium fredii]
MDWNRIEGNWKQVKGKIKEQWGQLTDVSWTRSPSTVTSSKARSRNATASRGTVSGATSTIGIIARPGIGNASRARPEPRSAGSG